MKNRQMSETMMIACLITFSGGLQDAYTYFAREKVFANAQTGNIVLMGAHMLDGDLTSVLRYLIPVLSFAAGIFVCEQISARYKEERKLHWRQRILAMEILALTASAFFPSSMNLPANSLISFSCAMQVQAFRSAHGYPYASTMCIGNLRSCVDAFSAWTRTCNPDKAKQCRHYLLVIFIFALGAATGYGLIPYLGMYTILVSSAVLSIACLSMFIRK
ncbi:MAG: YoaK family protein [Bulleidia sp.]